MARMFEHTSEQVAGYQEWLKSRPQEVQDLMVKFDPWSLYRMKSTDKRVSIVSCDEITGEGLKMRVKVEAEYNLVVMERDVMGVDPSDLEPCDLPGPDEPVGFVGASF